MTKNNYEVDILINGRPVKEYKHDGNLYIEGRKGSRFSLRIRNNGFDEILAVPSIDGLSVMDGKPCSANKSRGYIIKGYNSVTIDGWRTSDKEVAEFYFSDLLNSYANASDHGVQNTGVIGVAIFGKKIQSYLSFTGPNIGSVWPSGGGGGSGVLLSANSNFPQTVGAITANAGATGATNISNQFYSANTAGLIEMSTKVAQQQVGTGFGVAKRSEIERVHFGREDNARETFKILYNTKEKLQEIGINMGRTVVHISEPEAFPGDYCKIPANNLVFYGPHPCERCGEEIAKVAREQGGDEYQYPEGPVYPNSEWRPHKCKNN